MNWLLSVKLLCVLDVESDKRPVSPDTDKTASGSCAADLKKSHNSAAASISACHAFLPWPIIVAATILDRYFPEIKSAAFKKMAALWLNGSFSQELLAPSAPSMASLISRG